MKPMWLALLIGLGALAGSAQGGQPASTTTWYAVTAEDGGAIGHASREIIVHPDGREIVDAQEMLLREQDSPTTKVSSRTVRREDAAGATLSVSVVSQTGALVSRNEARILGDHAEIVRRTANDRQVVNVSLPPGIRFDTGEGLLPGWNPATTPRLEADNFNIDAMLVEQIVFEPGPPSAIPGTVNVLRKRYDGGELRGIARLTLDPQGRIVAVTQPLFGTSLNVRVVERAVALAPHPPYRVFPKVMTKSPFRIPGSALQSHIRYRFAFHDGLAFALPQTGEQRATPGSEGGVVVDICETCGPGLASDPADLADARRSTTWLQSDHPRLKAIAAPVARLNVSDSRKMELLVQLAQPYLGRIDFTGHFSALDMLSRRAGDCTEASVLLAALGRAAGIPTKVVNGLVYSRERYHGVSNAFLPHSWVLAYTDGRWRSYDAALLTFDTTHIALTIGDGDARSILAAGQLASLLEWKDLSEIRTRSGT